MLRCASLLSALAVIGCLPAAAVGQWTEDFDSYPLGGLIGQGGWEGWFGDPSTDAFVSDAYARSGPHSVEIAGPTDVVHLFSGCTAGQWTFTAYQYIPLDATGQSSFNMLNTYEYLGGDDWIGVHSVWTKYFCQDGLAISRVGNASRPLVKGEWVEIRAEIDLDTDNVKIYYNGELLTRTGWSLAIADGIVNIAAVDLYADGCTPVYYDDLSLVGTSQEPGACCLPDGTCVPDLMINDCWALGGYWQGAGITCVPNPCGPLIGACCFLDGSCVEMSAGDCSIAGGAFQGDGTTCVPNPCLQPLADVCANAIVIDAVPFLTLVDNTDATPDGPEGTCDKWYPTSTGLMQNDAWWAWTASEDCTATATATPVNADYDVILAIRDNCMDLTEPYCADDAGTGGAETINFAATMGTTYYFQVGDVGNLEGGGLTTFELTCEASCPGDLDGDGFRNMTDFTLFAGAYGSQVGDPNYNPNADFNGDGFVNITDFTVFAGYYLQPCP